jgi:hypothetical protein
MKLAAVGLLALFGAAPVKGIDLLKAFRPQLPKIHRATSVPVLLPAKLPLAGQATFKVYATGEGSRNGWDLELAAVPRCGAADACFVASFDAKRGGKLPRRSNLTLSTGDRAAFHGVSCGGSCAPASLWFVHRGALYTWQVKEPPRHARAVLARLAEQAIEAGAR